MKHLGRGFFVLVDAAKREVSPRAPGEAWLAFDGPGHMTLVIHPDETDADGMVSLTPGRPGLFHIAYGLDDQGVVLVQEQSFIHRPGYDFHIDWNPMLDVML